MLRRGAQSRVQVYGPCWEAPVIEEQARDHQLPCHLVDSPDRQAHAQRALPLHELPAVLPTADACMCSRCLALCHHMFSQEECSSGACAGCLPFRHLGVVQSIHAEEEPTPVYSPWLGLDE